NDEALSMGYLDLDFAFSFGSAMTYSIRELGNYKSDGSLVAGNVCRIEIASNGDILYKKNGQTVYTTSNPSKGYPYYLVFKTQETAGNGISAAKVQIGTPTPTPTPTAPPTPSPTPTPTPMPTPTPTPTAEVVLYASEGVWVGNYLLTSDPTAAGGARLDNPD